MPAEPTASSYPPAPAPPPPSSPSASSPQQPGHPRHWEADVVASDGAVVHLRPILPTDAPALLEFHERLSARTRYLRFFGPYPRMRSLALDPVLASAKGAFVTGARIFLGPPATRADTGPRRLR